MADHSLEKIDAVILCGGLGTRLRATIGEKQKTMAEINGQPFLDILLEYFSRQGFRRAVLCAGYRAEHMMTHYGHGKFGMTIEFSLEKEPLGTGGALKQAKGLIHSDPFMVFNGDCFCEMSYADFLATHQQRRAQISMAVTHLKDKKDFGSITVAPDGRILNFQEKVADTKSGFISVGSYCLAQAAFAWMPAKNVFMLEKEFFPLNLDKQIFSYQSAGAFIDIGTPERFARAHDILKKMR